MGEQETRGLSLVPVGDAPCRERDGRVRIEAWRQYVLHGSSAERVAEAARRLGNVATALSPTDLLLCFGNAVGLVDLDPSLRIDVSTGKLAEPQFRSMLGDIVRVAASLAFAGGTPTALPYDRSQPAHLDPDYHAFVYLRHVLSATRSDEGALLPALQMVLREPHRRFERETVLAPLDQIRRAEPAALQRLPGCGRLVPVLPECAGRMAFHDLLRVERPGGVQHYLPTHLEERHAVLSLDTPENRLVKALLDEVLGVADRIAAWAQANGGVFAATLEHECRWMREAVEPIRRHGLWEGVGPLAHVPAASTVLQRRRGYRDVYRHYSRLHLASEALPPGVVRQLLETKDIALLYELWSFYRIAEALVKQWGRPAGVGSLRRGLFAVDVPHELAVRWPNGACLLYNATFSRGGRRRSYSLPLRPDATLILPDGTVHLLDAKLRVDAADITCAANHAGTDGEVAEQEVQERQRTFKSDDLYKMHTYKDAIPEAQTVWILYPGDTFAYFGKKTGVAREPGGLPSALGGVGAVPLQPEGTDLLWELLAHLAAPPEGVRTS